jgi:hypothetical protein
MGLFADPICTFPASNHRYNYANFWKVFGLKLNPEFESYFFFVHVVCVCIFQCLVSILL